MTLSCTIQNAPAAPATASKGGMVTFTNTPAGLNAKLAANYADFSFQFPANWQLLQQGVQPGSINFVKVQHDQNSFTLENFAVGYYTGSPALAPALMAKLEPSFAKGFPNYTRVYKGNAQFNSRYKAYELTFTSSTKDKAGKPIRIYGKVFLIAATPTSKRGVSIVMLGTSKAPYLQGLSGLGTKGDLPKIINSFKLGK